MRSLEGLKRQNPGIVVPGTLVILWKVVYYFTLGNSLNIC